MGMREGQQPTQKARRYIVVSIWDTHEQAKEVRHEIERFISDETDFGYEDVSIFGCDGCGCQEYWPEPESCEDELCGHECDTCGCVAYE